MANECPLSLSCRSMLLDNFPGDNIFPEMAREDSYLLGVIKNQTPLLVLPIIFKRFIILFYSQLFFGVRYICNILV